MSIWVVCEGSGNQFKSTTFELLSKARALGPDSAAVVLGPEISAARALDGAAARVFTIDAGEYESDGWTESLTALLKEHAPKLVLFGDSARTRELLPRLAARLDGLAFTNAVDLSLDGSSYLIKKPVYGGKAYAVYSTGGRTALAAFRPNSFAKDASNAATTEFVEVSPVKAAPRVTVLERTVREAKRVDLLEAQRVVSAGRGLKAPENMKLVEDLADALGGAVGVSRAIVDAGWASHAIQVGKSGKTVSPSLYFAVGISGAVHHTMGMDTSKVVVAINSDPKAPIFNYADYGIAGDALVVLPLLTEALRKAAG